MKKILTIILSLMLLALAFTGCGSSSGDKDQSGGAVKTGVGVVSTIEKSVPPKDGQNGAQPVR